MKITLIYLGISWSGFNTFGKKDCGECNFIHHGIASIAAYLKENEVEVNYLDLRKLKNWDDFRKKIKEDKNNIFGISSTTVDFDYSIKAAKIIKKIKPKSKIIVGGVHPTVRPGDALKIKEFDYVVTGEGELSILEIIKAISKRKKIKRLVIGESCDLRNIPHIDRDLFDHRHGEMINPFVSDLEVPFTTVMSSRGCPYNCTFCQPAERMVFKGKVRLRDMKDVVSELVEINEKYGLKSFLIHDDLFILSRERILEFISLYKKSGLTAKFMCQGRADLIIRYEKEIGKLARVGLIGMMIGFESGSQKILDFLHKGTTVKDNLRSADICRKYGVKIWANYMLGIPSENYWDMIKTLVMIRKIKPDYYSPSLFTPYPETGLYDYCKERNLLIFKHFNQYRRSLSGDKIKGFNYSVIRLMIFLFMPFKKKKEIIIYMFNQFWKK